MSPSDLSFGSYLIHLKENNTKSFFCLQHSEFQVNALCLDSFLLCLSSTFYLSFIKSNSFEFKGNLKLKEYNTFIFTLEKN